MAAQRIQAPSVSDRAVRVGGGIEQRHPHADDKPPKLALNGKVMLSAGNNRLPERQSLGRKK